MPDSDPPQPSEPANPANPAVRNLPVLVSRSVDGVRPGAQGWLARALRRLFGRRSDSIRSDLRHVLEAGDGSALSTKESVMLRNILALRGRQVVDVMIPRADIVAVQQDIALGELLKVFASAEHSRLVVYDDTLDDAVGMVHIRDLIALMTERAGQAGAKMPGKRKKPFPAGLDLKAIDLSIPLSEAKIMREILFVPPSMPAVELLAKMQATHIHLALVVDEYGGTDGAVSMEDIVEEIVGEIADEHDDDVTPGVIRQPDGSFVADARAPLEDVTAVVGAEFAVGEIANEVDTLAGYVATRIGRVPVRGEMIPGPGRFEIEVLDADPRRVKKLKISLGLERNGGGDEAPRSDTSGQRAASPPTPSPSPELPITSDASVKLSPDVPSKASRRS
jgi:CBS domain containing-hemolysin-like protein